MLYKSVTSTSPVRLQGAFISDDELSKLLDAVRCGEVSYDPTLMSALSKGEDATVNWPNLDFRFRNDTQWPIFIVAYYANRKVTVEIYGMTLGEGITIDLESKVTYTKEPPAEPKYVYDASLAVGKEEVSVKARTGYTVETYKVWYKNGQEFKREKLHTSNYQMYRKTIKYNDGYGFDNRN